MRDPRVECVQFEERVSDLEHEDVRVSVVVDDQHALDGSSHAKVFIVVLQPLESRLDRGIFFWLGFFRASEIRNKDV